MRLPSDTEVADFGKRLGLKVEEVWLRMSDGLARDFLALENVSGRRNEATSRTGVLTTDEQEAVGELLTDHLEVAASKAT